MGGLKMGHRFSFKVFSYFLCVSFLLQVGGVSGILAEEKGRNFPIGEMVSRGEVKYEAREKIWQKVEPSFFPIFQGSKIKTEKGSAIISLKSDIQIEMGANTVLLFDRRDQIQLFQGHLNFRINTPEGISIRVGKITVATSPSRSASAGMVVSKKDIAAIGTVRVHSNNSVTIQSTEGQLLVLNPQGVTLATLSPKESLSLPPGLVDNPPSEKTQKMMFAQVGEVTPTPEEEDTYWGLSKWSWGAIGLGVIGLFGIGLAAGGGGGGGGSSSPPPVCR
jgi:hypothetical protein